VFYGPEQCTKVFDETDAIGYEIFRIMLLSYKERRTRHHYFIGAYFTLGGSDQDKILIFTS